jgi:hypothetical protein
MKCYTSAASGLTRGILVQGDPLGVFLGEVGRRRHSSRVLLDYRDAPRVTHQIRHGVRLDQVTDVLPIEGEEGWLLARATEPGSQVLVRVRTSAMFVRGAVGSWEILEGQPRILAEGFGAHGILGELGSWADDLVTLAVGDALRVQPQGTDPYILRHTDEGLGHEDETPQA